MLSQVKANVHGYQKPVKLSEQLSICALTEELKQQE